MSSQEASPDASDDPGAATDGPTPGEMFPEGARTLKQRRFLRKKYHELVVRTEEDHDELAKPSGARRLNAMMGQGDVLSQRVAHGREGNLDSALWATYSDLVVRQVDGIRLGKTFDLDGFMAAILTKYAPNGASDAIDEENEEDENDDNIQRTLDFDWQSFGESVGGLFVGGLPHISLFPLGEIQPRKRITRTRRKEVDVTIAETEETSSDSQTVFQKESSKLHARIRSKFRRKRTRSLRLAECINVSQGYGDFAYEIFLLAFLVREGAIQMAVNDEDGDILLVQKRPHRKTDQTTGQTRPDLQYKRAIFRINHELFCGYKRLRDLSKQQEEQEQEQEEESDSEHSPPPKKRRRKH